MQSDKQRRILIVLRRYPPFNGGVENQISRIATSLFQADMNVTVLAGKHDNSLPSFREERGVMVRRFYEPQIRILRSVFFLSALVCRMLGTRSFYDIVFTYQVNETSFAAILMGKLLGKKVICGLGSMGAHGDIANSRKKSFGALYRSSLRFVDSFIGQTDLFFEEIEKYGFDKNRMTVIPNPITSDFLNLKRNVTTTTTKHVLWCGRLSEVKNPMMIVPIAKELKKQHISFIIDVVGNGELKDALEMAIASEKLDENIILHGFQKNMIPFYTRADVLLLTSISDALPNVVLEAMAVGIPVVATDVGGVSKLVQHEKTGFLIHSTDYVKATERISELFENDELSSSMGKAAKDYVINNLTMSAIAERYSKLFDSLLEI